MCTKTNNHIYAELNCNVYEDFLEISKKILQIAFSIFDKPSFAAFASKLLHFRLKPLQYSMLPRVLLSTRSVTRVPVRGKALQNWAR